MRALPEAFDPFSRDVLEFPTVVELFRPLLTGPLSHPALAAVEPHTDPTTIRSALQLVREASQYLSLSPRPILAGLADPREILERIRIEGVSCSTAEIFSLIELARAAGGWREVFADTPLAALHSMTQSLPDLRDLIAAIGGKILPDGSVDSSASPALGAIRRSIERLERELHAALEKLLRRFGQDEALQEELITLRNGRFVLPVRAEKRRTVQGIVHGASSSGASVYVEPIETVPLNNELVELEEREVAEVRRILAEFTGKLRGRRDDLLAATATLSELDLAFAKAEFARQWDACLPEFSERWELRIEGARHPLLEQTLRNEGRQAVPLDLELTSPHTMMVISGPNTGGKTVALKTAGVAALMAQAGLPVLAREARLPIFERILADIGDQQSISQSLSTFSAHIRNIQSMVEATEGRDLVLLDEIGGSTDPQEGAALAVAILERFRARGCMVLVSTHLSRLKAYAAETSEAMNAAMDFDEATLAPTYRIFSGLPGKSSGIDIAQRLGMDGAIIRNARELMDPADAQAAALIASLHTKHSELDALLDSTRRQTREIEELKSRIAKQTAAERQTKLRELDQRLEHTLREYDQQFKRAVEEIRRELQQEGKSARGLAGSGRKAERLRRGAHETWNAQVLEAAGAPAEPGSALAAEGLAAAVGDQVQVQNFSTPGVVTGIRAADEIEVEIGRLHLRVRRNDVRVLARGHSVPSGRFESNVAVSTAPPAELNVIGQTTEEAREEVDKFLDNAFLAGRFKLRIVHGHGKGVLKNSLREMFASHPHVDRFYPAAQHEGGEGATMVELKK